MDNTVSEITRYLKSRNIISIKNVSYLGRGHANDNFFVRGKDGVFVLRTCRQDIPKEESRLFNEYIIYHFLECSGYPWVPRPVFFDKSRKRSLITFTPGKVTNIKRLSLPRLDTLAERMAEYHQLSYKSFECFCKKHNYPYTKPVAPREDFERFEKQRFTFIKEKCKNRNFVDWLTQRVEEFEELVHQHPLGEPNLIHGDIRGNTLHDGKGNFYFVDWELGRFSYYNDIGFIFGGAVSFKELDPQKISIYLGHTGEDMKTLKFKLRYSQYGKYVSGALWSLHRYIVMTEEKLPRAESYYRRALKARRDFERIR